MADFYGTMPSELPTTLPAGTTVNGYVATEPLTLRGGDYWGTRSFGGEPANGGQPMRSTPGGFDWTKIPIQSPPQEELGECDACGGKACRTSDGAEYAYGPDNERNAHLCAVCWKLSVGETTKAILARRAAEEIREGDWCSGVQVVTGRRLLGYMRASQWYNSEQPTVSLAPSRGRSGFGQYVWSDSLRREEEPKKEEHVHVFGIEEQCHGCGKTTLQLCGEQVDAKPNKGNFKISIEIPQSDPYRNAVRDLGAAVWQQTQTGIATGLSKRERAKEQLDRKFGPMGDRCKYGAKLGGGWTTDTEEP
jgi:hypothetical protein